MAKTPKEQAALDAMNGHNYPDRCRNCRQGDSAGMCSKMSSLYAAYVRANFEAAGIDPEVSPGVRAEMRRNGIEPRPLNEIPTALGGDGP